MIGNHVMEPEPRYLEHARARHIYGRGGYNVKEVNNCHNLTPRRRLQKFSITVIQK